MAGFVNGWDPATAQRWQTGGWPSYRYWIIYDDRRVANEISAQMFNRLWSTYCSTSR